MFQRAKSTTRTAGNAPSLCAGSTRSAADAKSPHKAASPGPTPSRHPRALLTAVNQPRNTFCTPEIGAAVLSSTPKPPWLTHTGKLRLGSWSKSVTCLDNKALGSPCKHFKFPTRREKLSKLRALFPLKSINCLWHSDKKSSSNC